MLRAFPSPPKQAQHEGSEIFTKRLTAFFRSRLPPALQPPAPCPPRPPCRPPREPQGLGTQEVMRGHCPGSATAGRVAGCHEYCREVAALRTRAFSVQQGLGGGMFLMTSTLPLRPRRARDPLSYLGTGGNCLRKSAWSLGFKSQDSWMLPGAP